MIEFEKYKLKNGLTVILHQDKTTSVITVNTIYNVGARDESNHQTGFAHLFEHLMFGGSKHIENFDKPLQLAGGESNAFTNNDITNYYCTVPSANLETVFWLESDRMLELAFTPKSLSVQKSVVIEEFKQRYLNQPYGDVWHEFRPLIFKNHPYQWPTIGKDISHIENAVMGDVKSFFKKHYNPQNAIIVVGGDFDSKSIKKLIDKWYTSIPSGEKYIRHIKPEPKQVEYREKIIERKVPSNAIYMAFRVGNRLSDDYFYGDLTSDILSGSKSARLYENLVKNKKIFSQISAYISSGWEHGLFIITGFLNDSIDFSIAEQEIWKEIDELKSTLIDNHELIKVKNKFKTAKAFQDQSLLNRLINIAQFELLGKLNEINQENENYDKISSQDIKEFASTHFNKSNCSVIKVKAVK